MVVKKETKKKRVGVLRGGTGNNYRSSLLKGGNIIAHIAENLGDKYKIVDILIDKNGVWHLGGLPIDPPELTHKIDLAWNVADPNFSIILDHFSIPNVSNSSFFSSLENNNDLLRNSMKNAGVVMPRSVVLPLYQEDFDASLPSQVGSWQGSRERYAIKKAKEIHEKFGAPWIVKSFTPDRNMAIHVAKTFGELVGAIEDGVKHEKSVLVEELILGKVATLHSMPDFRSEKIYTFPFGKFASSFSSSEKEELTSFVRDLYKNIGAKHYLKADFVLSPTRGICLLGIDGTPDFRVNSHFNEACESAGVKTHNIIEHILEGVS